MTGRRAQYKPQQWRHAWWAPAPSSQGGLHASAGVRGCQAWAQLTTACSSMVGQFIASRLQKKGSKNRAGVCVQRSARQQKHGQSNKQVCSQSSQAVGRSLCKTVILCRLSKPAGCFGGRCCSRVGAGPSSPPCDRAAGHLCPRWANETRRPHRMSQQRATGLPACAR